LGPRFRYLWATFLVASLGDGVGYGAVPLLALVVDPRPLAVSGVASADTFPWLVLALPAGALADRFERGRVMAVTNLGRALVLVALALLVATERIDYLLLVILVFINGGARAIYYSASQATVPELVEPQAFPRANGILSGTEAATEHLGGPVAGTLAFAAIRSVPFVADAAAIGLSGLSLLRLRTERLEPSSAHGSILDGVKQLVKDRSLRLLVTLLAALAGLQGLVMGVLVIIATVDWGVSKGLYGLFLAAGAAGNVPGALLADRVSHRFGNVPTLVVSALVSGLAYLVMASARGWLLAGAAFFVVCFVVSVGSVMANSLRQRLSPPELMGRVGSAWRGVVWGAFPIGSLIGGVIAEKWGIRIPIWTAGVAQCVVALALAAPLHHSLAASEKAATSDLGARAATGSSNGNQPLPGTGGLTMTPNLEIGPPPPPTGRRLHSRPGRGPLYWGRSSRRR
jgi:MFS family permease